MHDFSDMALVREYVRVNSETAFAELVDRHIALVYSAAFRHAGIAAHAEEITQAVFIILARKAAGLRPDTILAGWLCETTRLTALSFMRGEHRRQRREQEAYMQSTLRESTDETVWNQLSPLLDEAMARLGRKERDAVVLRYFKDQNLREVAGMLNINEPAAQKRVNRALEKLRKFFLKRGVTSTTATIAGAISANSVQAAPVALAKSVTTVAIAKGTTASISTLTLIKGALKIMAWTKAKTVIVAGVVVLLAAGTTTIVVKESRSPARQLSWSKPPNYPGDWIWEGNSATLAQVPPLLILRPTQLPASWVPFDMFGENRYLARGKTLKELISAVYSQKDSSAKINFLIPLPDNKFDCLVVLQNTNWQATNWPDALRSEINTRFNLAEQWTSQTGETVITVEKAK